MTSANGQTFQSSWVIRMKNRRSRLTALTLIWFLWDVKEPTPLFEQSRGCRPRCCGQPSLITSVTSWVGWVQQPHRWTESGCQWRLCMLMSEGMSVVLSSTTLHSFIHSCFFLRINLSFLNAGNIYTHSIFFYSYQPQRGLSLFTCYRSVQSTVHLAEQINNYSTPQLISGYSLP